MAALGRGPPAMKGGGDKKQQHQAAGGRLLPVAGACFLLFVVFALSSRYNATLVLDAHTRRGEFRPSSQKDSSHGGEKPVIRGGSNNGVGRGAEQLEKAEVESSAAVAADATSNNSDEQAKQATEDAHPDQAKMLTAATGTAAQPVVQASSPRHQHPGDMTRAASVKNQQRQPLCDLSGSRADVCDLTGDVRLDANASAFIVVVDPTAANNGPPTAAYKVRPYARKGDATSMSRVTEITVRTTTTTAPPRCTVTHAEPAVVFSVGGYAGNLFHDFTDVLVPLYGAAHRFAGDVRLVVADAGAGSSSRWMARYAAVLRALSRHPPLDLAKAAAAAEVHCFGHVVVGLRAHRELMIEPEPERGGVGMADFARFLRRALSLPRNAVTTVTAGSPSRKKKPRLLIVARRGTRRLLNADAVARAAGEVGFEAVVSELEQQPQQAAADDDGVAGTARLVNSFDAVVGVHGAGLTNMVFLPAGATVVQVVPWGGLQWIARVDFGDPAEAMGLRYIQYEVAVHESSLVDKYPRDHEIFTNPTALHSKGFKFLRHTFLIGQDVTIDVDRFRAVLLQALQNLTKKK